MSLTPVINYSAVSMIAGVVDTSEQFIAGDNETGDYFIEKSVISPAADGVIGTAMKSCIQKHTHLDQRPLRPPKLKNAILV